MVLALALLLRLNGYPDVPGAGANADEWAWGWAGMTLWTKGVPTGWSYLPAYPDPHVVTLHGLGYPLVTPWLDHPPLFALLVGIFPALAGQHTLAAVSTAAIRLPAVLLGTGSVALAQVLGRRLLGPAAGLAGTALLAVAPAAVLFSREVEAEALLAVELLVVLWMLHRLGTAEGGRGAAGVVIALAGLGPLTKIPGLAVTVVAVSVLLYLRLWWPAALAAAAGLAGLAVYVAYGAHYDWRLFQDVVAAQASRRAGVMGGFEFLVQPAGVNQRLRDGWWLLGWIAIVAVPGGSPARRWLLAWPAAIYVLAIVVFADERVTARYGWYHIAVYPEVYLAAAGLAWRAAREAEPVRLALVLALGGASATTLWLGTPWVPPGPLLIVLLALLIGPALAAAAWPERSLLRPLGRWVATAGLALMLLGLLVESLFLAANLPFF